MSQEYAGRRKASGGRARPLLWAIALILSAVVVIVGLIIVFMAGLHDLGFALVGGGFVTGAGIALERTLEHRRSARREQVSQRNRAEMIKYAGTFLSRLVIRHAQELYVVLLSSPAQQSHAMVRLEGCDVPRALLMRGVQWVADKDIAGVDWYVNRRMVETVDILLQTGTYLAEIENRQIDDQKLRALRFHTQETSDRLAKTADFLSQGGDLSTAQKVADLASTLRGAADTLSFRPFVGEDELQLPQRDPSTDSNGITIISGEHDVDPGILFIRQSIGYLTDKLREGFDAPYGDGTAKAPSQAVPRRVIDQPSNDDIVRRRWGQLLTDRKDDALWANRFGEHSWLRQVLEEASREVQKNWGMESLPPRKHNVGE